MKTLKTEALPDYQEFITEELLKHERIEFLILQSHILLEYSINCYLESLSKTPDANFFKANFTFAQKIELLKHFGSMSKEKYPRFEELALINKLRNDIAHTLTYNDRHLKDLLRKFEATIPIPLEALGTQLDKFRESISYLLGEFTVRYHMNINPMDFKSYLDTVKQKYAIK